MPGQIGRLEKAPAFVLMLTLILGGGATPGFKCSMETSGSAYTVFSSFIVSAAEITAMEACAGVLPSSPSPTRIFEFWLAGKVLTADPILDVVVKIILVFPKLN